MSGRAALTRWAWILVPIALGGCVHAAAERRPDDVADVRAAIDAANASFAQALVRGDAKAMADIFADDGEIIPTSQSGFVTGRGEIEAYQAKRLQARRYVEAAITTVHLEVAGDLAWEAGTNRVTLRQGDGAPVTLTGRYLAVWKRGADGRWRIRAELPITDPVE